MIRTRGVWRYTSEAGSCAREVEAPGRAVDFCMNHSPVCVFLSSLCLFLREKYLFFFLIYVFLRLDI